MQDEQAEWRQKYNPKTLKLGMVPPDAFVDLNDIEYFTLLTKRVEQVESHLGERLPDDFRKYILYCGPMFFNWSCCGIRLSGWNPAHQIDERAFCLWCPQPLVGTTCACNNFFDGSDLNNDETPGLVLFSHEGCGFFKFIAIKGPLKGTIWSGNPNRDDDENYLTPDTQSFKELLDSIYDKKK